MKCHFIAIRPANIKSLTTPSIDEDMETQISAYTPGSVLWGAIWPYLTTLKKSISYDPTKQFCMAQKSLL